MLDSAGTLLGVLRGHEDDRDGLLVALAMVTPRGERRDLAALLGGTPPGPLVYVTGRLDEEDAALLRPAGPQHRCCSAPIRSRERRTPPASTAGP